MSVTIVAPNPAAGDPTGLQNVFGVTGTEMNTACTFPPASQGADGWVTKFSGMKPEVVAEMTLPVYASEFNVPSLQQNLDMAVRYKMSKPFDVKTMIWKP